MGSEIPLCDLKVVKYLEELSGKKATVNSDQLRERSIPEKQWQGPELVYRNPSLKQEGRSSSGLRDKAHRIYEFILENYMFKPEIDIGNKSNNLKNDSDSLETRIDGKDGYNSTLLFTEIAQLMPKSAILYLGEPGSGKTSSPVLFSQYCLGIEEMDVRRAMIRGNPELTTSDILAYTDVGALISKGIEIVHPRSFMRSTVRIIDEVNRIPPGKVAMLYDVADVGEVNYKNKIIKAPKGPLFATANFKDSGNYAMQKPFLDRFDILLKATPVNPLYAGISKRAIQKGVEPFSAEEIHAVRHEIHDLRWNPEAHARLSYFLNEIDGCDLGGREISQKVKQNAWNRKPGTICEDCLYFTPMNICSMTEDGTTTRMIDAIYRFSEAYAWWNGKETVEVEDVSEVAPYVMAHKLTPTRNASNPDYKNDRVSFIRDLWITSMESFDKTAEIMPLVREMPDIIEEVYRGELFQGRKKDIKHALENEVRYIESPSKFPLETALYDIYRRLR